MTRRPHRVTLAGLALAAVAVLAAPPAAAQAVQVASEEMAPGEEFSFTFDRAGFFEYHCHLHRWMLAEVEVGPAGSEAQEHRVAIRDGAGQADHVFDPGHLVVAAGDTVVWTNEGDARHQVWGDYVPEGAAAPGDGPGAGGEDTPAVGAGVLLVALGGVAAVGRLFKNRQNL